MKSKNLKYLILLTLFDYLRTTVNLLWFVGLNMLFVIRLASFVLSKKVKGKLLWSITHCNLNITTKKFHVKTYSKCMGESENPMFDNWWKIRVLNWKLKIRKLKIPGNYKWISHLIVFGRNSLASSLAWTETIVNREDWLWRPESINGANKDSKIYVGRSHDHAQSFVLRSCTIIIHELRNQHFSTG